MRWFQKRSPTDTPQHQVVDKRIRAKLNHLKTLVSLPAADYQCLYVQLVQQLVNRLSMTTATTWFSAFDATFGQACQALQQRRGWLLPPNSDSETSFREQEVWSYAIFTAALLKDSHQWFFKRLPPESAHAIDLECGKTHGSVLLLATVLIPAAGLDWLCRHEHVYRLWSAVMRGSTGTAENVIARILADVATPTLPSADTDATIESPPTEATTAIKAVAHRRTDLAQTILPPLSTLNAAQSPTSNKDDVLPSTGATPVKPLRVIDLEPADQHKPPVTRVTPCTTLPDDVTHRIAEKFWTWLAEGLRRKQLVMNSEGLYRVEEGLLIVLTPVIQCFMTAHLGKPLDHFDAQAIGQAQAKLIGELKQSKQLKRDPKGGVIWTYAHAKHPRDTYAGFLVAIADYFGGHQYPAVESDLYLQSIL